MVTQQWSNGTNKKKTGEAANDDMDHDEIEQWEETRNNNHINYVQKIVLA